MARTGNIQAGRKPKQNRFSHAAGICFLIIVVLALAAPAAGLSPGMISTASSANPSTYGDTITLTATLTSGGAPFGTPTGTVTFYDGATSLGTKSLISGVAGLTTSSLAAGSHSLTATYHGDANYATNTSSLPTQVINPVGSSSLLTSSANPIDYGNAVTFTATVAQASGSWTPTGTVTFKKDADVLGTGTLSSGTATFTAPSLAVGLYTITAVYGGDTNVTTSTGILVPDLTVRKAASTTAVSSSLNPSGSGDAVTFTATVSSPAGSGTPTGTVTFRDGGTNIAGGTDIALASGNATLTTSSLTTGSHSITAVYSGESNRFPSTSPALNQVVVVKEASSTSLSSSLNPSTYGNAVTYTATVTSASGTPTGTVTFRDGSVVLGTGTLSTGSATFSTASLPAGTHSITAEYGGDGGYLTSTSSALSQVVGKASSSTAISSGTGIATGGIIHIGIRAVVTSAYGTPTGNVTFYQDGQKSGTKDLSSGSTYISVAFPIGETHRYTAEYSGDTNYAASTSGTWVLENGWGHMEGASRQVFVPPTGNGGDDMAGSPFSQAAVASQQHAPTEQSTTVNVGGGTAVSQILVSGTGLNDLIVTSIPLSPGSLPPLGMPVYQVNDITPARYTTISGGTITFTVPGSWVLENHLLPGNIVMYHFTGGNWVALPTTLVTPGSGSSGSGSSGSGSSGSGSSGSGGSGAGSPSGGSSGSGISGSGSSGSGSSGGSGVGSNQISRTSYDYHAELGGSSGGKDNNPVDEDDGFSPFAIAGKPGADAAITATPQPKTLGELAATEPGPAPVVVTQTIVAQQTTPVPAPAGQMQAITPVPSLVLITAGLIILAAGGFVVRRWYIRRQNPALFEEYD